MRVKYLKGILVNSTRKKRTNNTRIPVGITHHEDEGCDLSGGKKCIDCPFPLDQNGECLRDLVKT